jgi:hypothetical protein
MSNLLTAAVAAKALKKDKTSMSPESTPKTLQESIFAKPLTWVIVAGIAIYFGSKLFKKLKTNKDLQAANKDINELEKNQKQNYSDGQYSIWAQQLFVAMSGLGTDENAIYRVFGYMVNDLDVAKLIRAFGVKDDESLGEWLAGDLDSSEIEKVNKILATKNIKYRF